MPGAKFSFDERIQQLLDFEAKNGHMFVPRSIGSLGEYCRDARRGKYKFDQEQKAKLDEIGFPWKALKGPERDVFIEWNKKFQLLVKFHKSKGHCNVPSAVAGKPYPLASWCDEQREKFGNDNLDQDKIDKLTRIGFDFFGTSEDAPKKRNEASSFDDEQEDESKPVSFVTYDK